MCWERNIIKKYLYLLIYSLGMGYVEAAVVIYLRRIFYPSGFSFPLCIITPDIFKVEIIREVATIGMILSISLISSLNSIERFCFFIFVFGVWDISYYVFLKIFINWPISILDWDILFLMPLAWLGPVLAPIIVSTTLICISIFTIYIRKKYKIIDANFWDVFLVFIGAFIIFINFIKESIVIIIKKIPISTYVPQTFNWFVFMIGELLMLLGFFIVFYKTKKFHLAKCHKE